MKKGIGIAVPEVIERRIILLRGQRVILDSHIAELYGVETKDLKRAVRRNRERFPDDFMLQLTVEEYDSLRRQFGALKRASIRNIFRLHLPNRGLQCSRLKRSAN